MLRQMIHSRRRGINVLKRRFNLIDTPSEESEAERTRVSTGKVKLVPRHGLLKNSAKKWRNLKKSKRIRTYQLRDDDMPPEKDEDDGPLNAETLALQDRDDIPLAPLPPLQRRTITLLE